MILTLIKYDFISLNVFIRSQLALDVLNNDDELKQYWRKSREWFQAEMEKCMMYDMRTYGYYQTPQSNETSQTYYLERTQSARLTLERAMQICPSQGDSADTEGSNHHQTPNESPISASITTPITTNHNRSSLIKKIGKKVFQSLFKRFKFKQCDILESRR